jgi:antitoxin MazE
MQVSKWGDSLAVRLPEDVVEALDLKEGDEVDVRVAKREAERDAERVRHAIEMIRSSRWSFPPDFKFDRLEANER